MTDHDIHCDCEACQETLARGICLAHPLTKRSMGLPEDVTIEQAREHLKRHAREMVEIAEEQMRDGIILTPEQMKRLDAWRRQSHGPTDDKKDGA